MIRKVKNIVTLFTAVLLIQCSVAQPGVIDKKSEKLFEKAKMAYQNRDDDGAMDILIDIIERSPNFPDAHMLKFQLHQEANDFTNAKKELESVVGLSPDFFKNAHLFLGRIYLSEGNYNGSLERLEYFTKYEKINQNLYNEAVVHIMTCNFALEAMKNPVPFDPQSMGDGVNSEFSEYFPSLTADDKTILFTRRVKKPNSEQEQEDFYISENVNGVWTRAKPMKFINTPMNEGAPSIAPDGELIVFTACENVYGEYGGDRRGLGSCDLFYSFRQGDSWTKPRNIGAEINSGNWETQPSLSADGRTIYFVRGIKKKDGLKNLDIYTSNLGADGVWTVAEKLSNVINTPKDESSVLIHPDGRSLYFTSNGHLGMGGEDVFLSRLDKNGEWGDPINLGYPINTFNNENSLVVSTSGELAYFASDRTGGLGGMDLYQFELYPEVRPEIVNYMQGFVFDKESKEPMQARFQLIDVSTKELVLESYSNPVDGKFLVTLPANREYALNVSSPDYLFYSEHFEFSSGSQSDPFLIDVPLSKVKSGSKLVLENIFFDTDKFKLREESSVEVEKIKEFLQDNPNLSVQISGHTDNVGNDEYNQKLSTDRAKSVADALIEVGINSERVKYKGFGSTNPISENETEAGRAKNRRTEMEIL